METYKPLHTPSSPNRKEDVLREQFIFALKNFIESHNLQLTTKGEKMLVEKYMEMALHLSSLDRERLMGDIFDYLSLLLPGMEGRGWSAGSIIFSLELESKKGAHNFIHGLEVLKAMREILGERELKKYAFWMLKCGWNIEELSTDEEFMRDFKRLLNHLKKYRGDYGWVIAESLQRFFSPSTSSHSRTAIRNTALYISLVKLSSKHYSPLTEGLWRFSPFIWRIVEGKSPLVEDAKALKLLFPEIFNTRLLILFGKLRRAGVGMEEIKRASKMLREMRRYRLDNITSSLWRYGQISYAELLLNVAYGIRMLDGFKGKSGERWIPPMFDSQVYLLARYNQSQLRSAAYTLSLLSELMLLKNVRIISNPEAEKRREERIKEIIEELRRKKILIHISAVYDHNGALYLDVKMKGMNESRYAVIPVIVRDKWHLSDWLEKMANIVPDPKNAMAIIDIHGSPDSLELATDSYLQSTDTEVLRKLANVANTIIFLSCYSAYTPLKPDMFYSELVKPSKGVLSRLGWFIYYVVNSDAEEKATQAIGKEILSLHLDPPLSPNIFLSLWKIMREKYGENFYLTGFPYPVFPARTSIHLPHGEEEIEVSYNSE